MNLFSPDGAPVSDMLEVFLVVKDFICSSGFTIVADVQINSGFGLP